MSSKKEPKHNFNRILKVCDISRYPELASEDYQNGKIKIKEQPHIMAYLMTQIEKVSVFINDTDDTDDINAPCICGHKLYKTSYTCLIKTTGKFIILGSACINNLSFEENQSKTKNKSVSLKTELLQSISGIFKHKLKSSEYMDIHDLNEYCDDIKAIWLKSLKEYVEAIIRNIDEKKYAVLLELEEYLNSLKESINCEDCDEIIETIKDNSLEYRRCINKLYDKKKCVVCKKYHTNLKYNSFCLKHIPHNVYIYKEEGGLFKLVEEFNSQEFTHLNATDSTYYSICKYVDPNFIPVKYYYCECTYKTLEEVYFNIYKKFISKFWKKHIKLADKINYLDLCLANNPVFKDDGILYDKLIDVKKYINSFANKAKSSIIPRIISYIELECPIEQRKCDICNETGIANWGDGLYSDCIVCGECIDSEETTMTGSEETSSPKYLACNNTTISYCVDEDASELSHTDDSSVKLSLTQLPEIDIA